MARNVFFSKTGQKETLSSFASRGGQRNTDTSKIEVIEEDIPCTLIHLSSCQDNQFADNGFKDEKESVFTRLFRTNLGETNFNGSYQEAFELLQAKSPRQQVPKMTIYTPPLKNRLFLDWPFLT